ncbi:MAG: peptidase C69 [Deltaproteobacteria bacterium]|nr:peptidase C69 [Deltaproteobacteria bacterium]|tara:strand:+ start:3464 stop:4843 length:1380 start_codon:yes stop_codon:yes gene_type:complete
MLSENLVKKILESGLKKGADFTEVFVEDSVSSSINLVDQKIDEINSSNSFGIGVRLLYGNEAYYGYSSDTNEENLLKIVNNLGQSRIDGKSMSIQPLKNQSVQDLHHVAINPETVSKSDRADLLRQLDKITRSHDQDICQVSANMAEKKRSVLIANSEGLWCEDTRSYSRVRLSAIAEKGDGPQSSSESPGVLGGYEFFKDLDLVEIAENTAKSALRMANAGYINGGILPVVLGNGFGGVIFHEACGHPLETEAVRKNASPFCGKIGMEVGQPILTAIDDGTIPNKWGSCNIDDEGTPTQKTVLIENGILKNFLSDRIGANQVGIARSGSARRESYKFAPVSRMRNTFIAPGHDTVDEMIQSIDFGLYAKKMGGGSVNPGTGEFNFAVQEGYAIRKGKISEPVRGATLIGKGFEVLPQISMIAKNLDLAAGMCGAASGWVPTTVGQPTLKIDSILVGGR